MDSIRGYAIEDVLYLGQLTTVRRARRLADGKPVVLKISREDEIATRHATRYQHEFHVLRHLQDPHVVGVYGIEQVGGRVMLVVEDCDGLSLRRVAGERPLPLPEVLAIATKVARGLKGIHAAGVIHRDVNPDNIVYVPDTGIVKLIDFGIATRDGGARLAAGRAFEGTLPYLSPEQTGRVSCTIDHRTDLYSFGATLYELLLGRPPHVSADAMEMVHFHLAVPPVPPHVLDPSIPEALSQIVVKLLAKSPSDRYQSARGLEEDLEECARQWAERGTIAPFAIGARDVVDRFEVSRTLYGREREVAALEAALARVTDEGVPETVLVSGYSGVGKTSVVRELHPAVAVRRGYFVSGKFDQLRRSVPYGGFLPALRELVDQLLAEDAASLARWRHDLLAALGGNGRVVAEVIPEIELVVGPLPPLPELGPVETLNRFKITFQDFVGVFCKRTHPLVVFLDDMQWADSATLDLITHLASAGGAESLLLLAAYRDNEVDHAHPFMRAIREQRELGARVSTIAVAPLRADDVTALVADTLRQPADVVAPLADMVWRKTGGNPFFVGQFLQTLHREQLIAFDPERGAFTFDLAKIDRVSITDNLADLLARELDKLPAGTRRALSLAAAIGGRFDLQTMSVVSEEPAERLWALLQPAVANEIVTPSFELVSVDESAVDAPLVPREYAFRHDRIQLAAYSTIPEDEREAAHLAIGRLLLAGSGDVEARIFDIVSHLNRGASGIIEPAERRSLALLNLRAGARARASGAYEAAAGNLRVGIDLLGPDAWAGDYEANFAAHSSLAECLSLLADFAAALDVIDRALPHARSQTDRGRLLTIRTSVLVAAGKMGDAVACGLDAARCFGLDLPTEPDKVAAQLPVLMGWIFERVGRDGFDALLELPPVQDPDVIATMTLLWRLSPPAFQTNPTLFMLIIGSLVRLSLENGYSSASVYAYVAFGCGLVAARGDYENGYAFGRLAVELNRRLDDRASRASVFFVMAAFVAPWKRPVEESLPLFDEGLDVARETGSFVYIGYHVFVRMMRLFHIGTPLPAIQQELTQMKPLLHRTGDAHNLTFLAPIEQLVRSLRGELPSAQTLDGAGFDEAGYLQRVTQVGNGSQIAACNLRLMMHRYLTRQFEGAIAAAMQVEQYPQFVGFIEGSESRVFGALARTAIYHEVDGERRAEFEAWLDSHDLAPYVERCPENFRDRYLLVQAERARVAGDPYRAMQLYDDAIAVASERRSLLIEAMARELAGRMWHERGRKELALAYLRGARQTYEQWGCTLKVQQLDDEFPTLGGRTAEIVPAHTFGGTMHGYNDALDLRTVVEASQTIAGELQLDALLAKMMRIILANAGADCGSLVLAADDGMRVQAFAEVGDERAVVLQGIELRDAARLSEGIVNYAARMRTTVVEDDAAVQGRFRNDPYVVAHRPKSVLAAPIVYQSRLVGVLYLENALIAGAFTRGRMEAIGILLAQIAVSIDNATLFAKERAQAEELARYQDHLEELVEERTRELKVAQSRLVEVSRQAGMAEIAAGVLHNVGNSLNSVNVAAEVIDRKLQRLHVSALTRVLDLLAGQEDIATFMRDDKRGRQVVPYLRQVTEVLVRERDSLRTECHELRERIDHIKVVVAQQQAHARAVAVIESTTVQDLVHEALALVRPLLGATVEVVPELEQLPRIAVDRHAVLQILVNLLRNAGQAVESTGRGCGRIRIAARGSEGTLEIRVDDDGVGVQAENMDRIFGYGFTTKAGGHGFGLHNSCNMARTMGGDLRCQSEGEGRGAAFTLTLPLQEAA